MFQPHISTTQVELLLFRYFWKEWAKYEKKLAFYKIFQVIFFIVLL